MATEVLEAHITYNVMYKESPEGVKWKLELAGLPWLQENGFQATLGLGFGHWEWEKNVKKSKVIIGFENC